MKKVEAEKAVNAFLEIVEETLVAEDKVSFTGFGSFEAGKRSARAGKNPSTGKAINIAETTVGKLKHDKNLKEAVAKM